MSNKILQLFKEHIGQTPPEMAPPFNKWLQGILVKAEEGEITMRFTIRKEMTNPVGMLHGGMHAAMIDEVIGMAVATANDETFYTTVNLTMDYLDKATLGESVLVTAKVLRMGKNMSHVEAQIFNHEGKLLSKGTSNLFNTRIPLKF